MVARKLDVALERRAQEVFRRLDIPRLHRDNIEQVAGSDRDLIACPLARRVLREHPDALYRRAVYLSRAPGRSHRVPSAQSIPAIDRYEVLECIARAVWVSSMKRSNGPRRRVAETFANPAALSYVPAAISE